MKVATIVPQNYLDLTAHDDYFMCLGNFIDEPGYEEYTAFFTQRAAEGSFVIMDNGLIEGNQRPIEELARKATKIGASEMVLTDVFCDRKATLEAIRADIKKLSSIVHPKPLLVAQGDSIDDWVACACTLINENKIRDFTLGVPKVLTKMGGRDGRIAALYQLVEACPPARHLEVHLLGCWTTSLEITILDKIRISESPNMPKIRGVDSAMPFVFARAGKRVNECDRPDDNPIDFKKSQVSRRLLKRNIKDWRKAGDIVPRGKLSKFLEGLLG